MIFSITPFLSGFFSSRFYEDPIDAVQAKIPIYPITILALTVWAAGLKASQSRTAEPPIRCGG
jgi:hypothetical protein